MARVCLILPIASASSLSAEGVARCREGLEEAGHSVEVLAVHDRREPSPTDPENGSWTWHPAGSDGLSAAAITGLWKAEAVHGVEYLIILDPTQGYHVEDLSRMLVPLVDGSADLVVARRRETPGAVARSGLTAQGYRLAADLAGRITRPLLGASDVFAGLVATTPDLARAVTRSFNPVGSRFTIDLLFRSKGRRAEVPVRVEGPRSPLAIRFDDIRHMKRLSDDRFGNASRLLQFCAVGASGMVIDLSCYALLQLLFSWTPLAYRTTPLIGGPLDLAVAGALAIAVALTWNFSLNRRLTFNYARGGSLARQYLTYALSNALGIALSFSLRLYLPEHIDFFHRHRLAAAVVGIVAATGISFSMSRWVVFSRRSVARDRERADARGRLKVVQTSSAR